ncbi:hypothetical protein [Candidatus Epulonipiscium viviparus]|uniref:hypothetical protein n=1 Tax=Candidatus Epulonipiscium viviparus TaxID=420336 RepID=UPI0027381442|nr:hypothetical protein [Candidatus Epulopiscium viviparus]
MVFLCQSENLFTKIEKNKQSLVAQSFCATGISRPVTLLSNITDEFCATIDTKGLIHLIVKNLKGQIIYIIYQNNQPKRALLFEESDGPFTFENFQLIYFNNILHLFYTAYDNLSNTNTLLRQTLNGLQSAVESVITNFTAPTFMCLSNNDHIYILFQEEQNATEIQCLTIGLAEPTLQTIVSAAMPILQYDACIIDDQIHVLYLQNMYGQNQLIYKTTTSEAIVATVVRFEDATMFKYIDCIWVNFVDGNILYTALSIDGAQTFSTPAKSSLQNDIVFTKFSATIKNSIQATHLFAQITTTIRLAVISAIDTIGIHPDLEENIELDMLIEGINIRYQQQLILLQQQVQQLTTQLQTKNSQPQMHNSYQSQMQGPQPQMHNSYQSQMQGPQPQMHNSYQSQMPESQPQMHNSYQSQMQGAATSDARASVRHAKERPLCGQRRSSRYSSTS